MRDASATLGEEERRRPESRNAGVPLPCVLLQGHARGVMDGHEAGLAELRTPDGEDTRTKVHVIAVERKCLAVAETGRGEKTEEGAVGVPSQPRARG